VKRLFSIPAVALAVLTAAAPIDAASLRPSIVIEGDLVRLGDIFEDAGPKSETAVLYSPAPGRRVTLNAAWLSEVARIYHVAWRPMSQYDRVVVERAGNVISTTDIIAALRVELVAKGMPKHQEIELTNRQLEIVVPVETPTILEVRSITYNPTSGQFSAVVSAGGDSPKAQRVMAQGRAHNAAAVPVLRRQVNAGEVIRREDIDIVYRRDDQLGRDVITDPNRLVGRTPAFRVKLGEPVRESEVRVPTLVKRNGHVVLKLEWGSMTLTAQGKALEEGGRGDVIRVENLQSNKTVEGTVSGPDTVTVTLGPRLAAN
jgi:flagellar basal body P-ring formation protein FlgA